MMGRSRGIVLCEGWNFVLAGNIHALKKLKVYLLDVRKKGFMLAATLEWRGF
jgi:hypothetical protein